METIEVDRADTGVVTVTMNRPAKKNAMNARMWHELLETFREVRGRDDDRVVVITGAGGAFSSGADLSAGEGPTRHQWHNMGMIHDVCHTLWYLPQPTIAKVPGIAVGAGMNLALLCDLVVAADDARFSAIFAKRGLSIDFGGSWVLPRLIGLHRAKELALLAEFITAKEAEDLGLVNRVVPVGELDAFVADWADRLAGGPPIALGLTKRLLNDSLNATFDQALEHEGAAQTVNIGTADTAEAVRAFLEKRQPVFRGR